MRHARSSLPARVFVATKTSMILTCDPAENASIVALKADPDDPDDFDVSAAGIARALADREKLRNKGGGPRGSDKERVTLRLDKAALDHFREGGAGWQTRINEAVRKAAGL